MSRPVSDVLSLTLPKARGRSRLRRPRRPTFWEVIYLGSAIACGVFAVVDWLAADVLFAIWQASGSGVYWWMWQRERRAPGLTPPWWALAWSALGIGMVWVIP